MVSLTTHIRVTVIKNAAGLSRGSKVSGSRLRAITYPPPPPRLSFKLPSARGSNFQELYDPSRPKKIINIMNFVGANSVEFTAFNAHDLNTALAPSAEANDRDDIVIIWNQLLNLRRTLLLDGLSKVVI